MLWVGHSGDVPTLLQSVLLYELWLKLLHSKGFSTIEIDCALGWPLWRCSNSVAVNTLIWTLFNIKGFSTIEIDCALGWPLWRCSNSVAVNTLIWTLFNIKGFSTIEIDCALGWPLWRGSNSVAVNTRIWYLIRMSSQQGFMYSGTNRLCSGLATVEMFQLCFSQYSDMNF